MPGEDVDFLDRVLKLVQEPLGKSLIGRDFLSLADYSPAELWQILRLAKKLKTRPQLPLLRGKSLGMIFAKSSTRTRISFEVGMSQLGGSVLFLSQQDIQLGRGETISDTARVLSRYLDAIMIRTYSQEDVAELAKWSSIPVINGLTDRFHPCQALADFFTIQEHFGVLAGLKLAFIGDGNNMAHSLMLGAAKFGADFAIACPSGYEPEAEVVAWARETAKTTGSNVEVLSDPGAAAQGAHILYTDVWASMGQEAEQQERLQAFRSYQVNRDLLGAAAPGAIIMHCLPAHRGEEITADVLEGPQSVVFDQAENRLHVQKAILALLVQQSIKKRLPSRPFPVRQQIALTAR